MLYCREKSTPGEVLIYFSVQGSAAEQRIIFRIPTPGQGIIFVKISKMLLFVKCSL